MLVWGGIEAGGTKFNCAIGSGPQDLRDELRIATATPAETIPQAIEFFQDWRRRHGPLEGIGIASFGPVDPREDSARFGYITNTPKPGWADTDFAGAVGRALDLPVAFDTDVNGAALGEAAWGAAQGLDTFIYLTVGTGIGGGGLSNGRLMHGLMHPEMGHVRVERIPQDDFPGCCPFHRDCLEGMASGPALEKRWGLPAHRLPSDHPAWEMEADYLAQAVYGYILALSPQRIVLGGGIMQGRPLLGRIRERVLRFDGGYLAGLSEGIEDLIVGTLLGARAGVLGAIALARLAGGQHLADLQA